MEISNCKTTKIALRTFATSIKNSLKSPSMHGDVILRSLNSLNAILLCRMCNELEKYGLHGVDLDVIRATFLSECYADLGSFLLQQLNVEWLRQLSEQKSEALFKSYFLCGSRHQGFAIMCHYIKDSRPGIGLSKCVSLLEEFLTQHKLKDIMCEMCQLTIEGKSGVDIPSIDQHTFDSMVNTIASLPDKMANKLQEQNSDLFYPKHYLPLIVTDVYATLAVVYERVKRSSDCSLEFISRLIGKLCLSGYGNLLWSSLLPQFISQVRSDFIWCRICERVITGVPDRCLESVLIPLLTQLPWFGFADKLLGDCVLTKPKVHFLLCTKLLLLHFSDQIQLLQNIIGYLSTSHTRRHLFIQVLKELLSVWSDSSGVRHRSYEQHLYISRAIFVCLAFLNTSEKSQHKEDCLEMLMSGMQFHIASSDPHRRNVSMAMAEAVSQVFNPGGPVLKFEYDKDQVKDLLLLMEIPKEPLPAQVSMGNSVTLTNSDGGRDGLKSETVSGSEYMKKEHETEGDLKCNVDEDLDSDDDLVPFDMSSDIPSNKIKSPKYIRECMEGLISSDNVEKQGICLAAAELLIRSSPDGLSEIAVEFTKILIHLTEAHIMEDFTRLRFGALVSLTVRCPVEVSDYLTEEFYNRNYNIRQRLDMLEVLAAAARELSTPEVSDTKNKVEQLPPEDSLEGWQEVIKKRVESKTRRFSKGRTKPEPVPVPNRFSSVSGHFFYPLLKNFDRKENTLNLLGEDSLVLGRLIFTLGIVMYAATNSPTCRRIAATLLEFIWTLRFHNDLGVRRAVLFAVAMIYLSVQPYTLLEDLQQEVLESKIWLEEVSEKDPDTECRKLAIQSLLLLESIIKQEFLKDG